MSSQPETVTYDASVYQLELTDPVQGGVGGVSNAPLLSLSNRTAYLKKHVDDLESGATIPSTVAPKASPALTGNPTAPTQALGDNDTSIATTAFVRGVVSGRLAKSVAGGSSVTLTEDESGYGILTLSGELTASISVIVPTPTPNRWIVENLTSGAYSLTVKTASGTGVTVKQGTRVELFSDGTNVYAADLVTSIAGRTGDVTLTAADVSGVASTDSPSLMGNPTAPTQALGDNDTSIATTAFVQATVSGVLSKSVAGGATVTLTAVEAGNGTLLLSGALTADIAVVVPTTSQRHWVVDNRTSGAYTLTVKTSSGSGVAVPQGLRATVFCDGTSVYFSDDAAVAITGSTGAAKLPAGTTAQRPTAIEGQIRYNSELQIFEGYSQGYWGQIGGGQMLGSAQVKAVFYNAQTIAEDITVPADNNAMSSGPITIETGSTVTVEDGGRWAIV
jgi:hypothetical protein